MSPEQFLGEELDGRSDIYSLGIVLYEMLSGSVPFSSPSIGALILQHVQKPPPPFREIYISTSSAVEEAVQRALEKEREARPQSALAFSEMLRAALHCNSTIPTIRVEPPIESASSGYHSAAAPPLAPTVAGSYSPGRNAGSAQKTTDVAAAGRSVNKRVGLLVAAISALVLLAGVAGWRTWLQGNTNSASGLNLPDTTGTLGPGEGAADRSPNGLAKAVARAEADYRNHRYDAVIATCNDILTAAPDQPRANLLLGESYYHIGSAKGVVYLGKAIDLGEIVTLAIKHHHYEGVLKLNDGFCSGQMRLKKGLVEFRSDEVSEHSFAVTPDKIYDLRDESYKGGRLHLKAGVKKGATEVADNYNFYAPTAGLRKQMTLMRVHCENPACQPMAQTLYQLLAQLKK